ncbi:hypothetical protein D3C83_270350 [compost metagenome]
MRLRGAWTGDAAQVAGHGAVPLADRMEADGATEFSIPRVGPYAVVDLAAAPGR